MALKWWHYALIGVGGYTVYKTLSKGTGLLGTGIPATGLTTTQAAAQATTDQLNALASAVQAKVAAAGVTQVGVTITDGKIIFTGIQTNPTTGSPTAIELFTATSLDDANRQIASL